MTSHGELQFRETPLLVCPVRGPLGASALAGDGLTPTEEARRVDFLRFLVQDRSYPSTHMRAEVVTIRNLGEKGRNQLRADVMVYDCEWDQIAASDPHEQLNHAILVAEIKRDTTNKRTGIRHQLEPALLVLPRIDAMGVYWDDQNRILLTKKVSGESITIREDTVANLPEFGIAYEHKPITVDTLTKPSNLVSTLQGLANVMRSNGINNQEVRYKETVKLLLARYVDERKARGTANRQLSLQVHAGTDHGFLRRVSQVYKDASVRYQRVRTLFSPTAESELDENTLKSLVSTIQGFDLSSASNDTMQQVFMTFAPVVFKRDLSQYFTPLTLIDAMVEMVAPGPTEKIADPAMGTADFLTSTLNYCAKRGDDDAVDRVYGIDSDPGAYDLAVVNMILNRDGQANLLCDDSIANHEIWEGEMDVVLCNPPFGARTIEKRADVLAHYDLGHTWFRKPTGEWAMKDQVARDQQLGILFIERCWKMLRPGGRIALILPEGYLSTAQHGYVRQWIVNHFLLQSLVELPRRIFVKSDVDLRSNILVGTKIIDAKLTIDYPIHASMVRNVGYKLGGNFAPIPLRDHASGIPIRDEANEIILDSDFRRVLDEYRTAHNQTSRIWAGATVSDITSRADLDMKPRRLVPRALANVHTLRRQDNAVALGEVVKVVLEKTDILHAFSSYSLRRVVEGQDIRAGEGLVVPQSPERCWSIAERKSRNMYELRGNDIVIGLVRPERRNVGILLNGGDDVIGSPDGIAVLRSATQQNEFPVAWLFAVLRSEKTRLQFWTESGGTSYGKLTIDQIQATLIPVPPVEERHRIAGVVSEWMTIAKGYSVAWSQIGANEDRRSILNSPLTGLFDD